MDDDHNPLRRLGRPLTYWLLMLAAVTLVLVVLGRQPGVVLSYSEFKLLLRAGKLAELRIADELVSGVLHADGLDKLLPPERVRALDCKRGCNFAAARVADPGLVGQLEQAGVRYTGEPKSGWFDSPLWWLAPMALVWWMLQWPGRSAGSVGMLGVGKSRARVYAQPPGDVHFADIAGIDEAKEELMELVEFLRHPERYRRLGARIPKGVLIVGAPGTGKTLLAKAVAAEAGVPFLAISGSEFVEMFVGVGAARVRDMFAQAVERAPCIIFIDELDALGRARGISAIEGGSSEQEQTLNQLLVEMDGFDSNSGVIILAATNRPEILDPALLRPGRFDRHIALDRPDLAGRRQILAVHVKRLRSSGQVDLDQLAARTAGCAGAELANLVNEAALLAGRKGRELVGPEDFDEALERVVAGLARKSRVMNATEKQTVAYHEAGHALVAEARPWADPVAKISIIPRGIAALGYTQQLPLGDRYLLRRGELLEQLDVLLGGRVAEELVFGDVSTGAQNDLLKATELARHMVLQYGMSERLGLASYDDSGAAWGYGRPGGPRTGFSEGTARAVDAEVARLLEAAHQRVQATLQQWRARLDTLAAALLQHETLDRAAIHAILGELKPAHPA